MLGELNVAKTTRTGDARTAIPTDPKTLTRADLAEAVYRSVGLSRIESSRFVEDVLNEISDALVRGDTIKLSSFGSFLVRAKTERIGRNPKTGIEAPISARRVMIFRPSNILKARVNGNSVDGLAD